MMMMMMKDPGETRLMDGCLKVDKGTEHQGRQRPALIPTFAFEGALHQMQPLCPTPSSAHPSLQLSFLFAIQASKFWFPRDA